MNCLYQGPLLVKHFRVVFRDLLSGGQVCGQGGLVVLICCVDFDVDSYFVDS